MIQEKRLNYIDKVLLLIATVIWGASFFILKNSLEVFPMYFLLSCRFLLSGIILGLLFFRRIIKLTRKQVFLGMILGVIVAVAYIVQTYGLTISGSSSKNAFLTASYCILVPFMTWIFYKEKPSIYNIIAGVLCIAGIGLVSLSNGFSVNPGDMLSLLSGVFFGLQIIFTSKYLKNIDSLSLITIELTTTGVIFAIMSLAMETGSYSTIVFSLETIFPLIYLTFFATIIGQLFQVMGQKHTGSSEASIILSLEAVFGVLFSVVFDGEKLSFQLIAGFIIIFIAIIISETKLDFLKRKKKTDNNTDK